MVNKSQKESMNNESNGNERNVETSLDDRKYQNPDIRGGVKGLTPEQEREMQKTREDLDELKKHILGKYKFTEGIGIIPPQAAQIFDDENDLTEE